MLRLMYGFITGPGKFWEDFCHTMGRMVFEELGNKVWNRFVNSVLPDTWGMVERTEFFWFLIQGFGEFTHTKNQKPNSEKRTY